MFMRRIVRAWKQHTSIAIAIPRDMAEKLGIDAGDYMELVLEGEEIKLRKV